MRESSSSTQESRNNKLFSAKDIAEVCRRLGLERAPEDLIETMHTESFLLKKGHKLYELGAI